jgi:MFS family permease
MRAMQGIGPAFLLPNGVALLGRAYPPGPRKNLVFSIFGLTAPTGFIVGALFSSLIAQFGWWPWIYWANCIACLLFAGLSWGCIPAMDGYNPEREMKGSLDLPGCLTGVTGLILINFAFNQGPVVGWPTVYVYVLLIVGFLFMGAFVRVSSRCKATIECKADPVSDCRAGDDATSVIVWFESRAPYPLVPMNSLTRELGLVMAAIGAGWGSFGIWICESCQFGNSIKPGSYGLCSYHCAFLAPQSTSGNSGRSYEETPHSKPPPKCSPSSSPEPLRR